MKQLLVIMGLIALTCACQPTGEKEMTIEERQEIAATIKQNFTETMALLQNNNQENFEKWMTTYVESNDEAWMKNPALWLQSLMLWSTKETIYDIWKPTEGVRSGTNLNIEEDYVAVLSPENAVYVLKGTYSVIDKDGNTSDDYPVSGTYVYVLRNGEWKTLHIHLSYLDQ